VSVERLLLTKERPSDDSAMTTRFSPKHDLSARKIGPRFTPVMIRQIIQNAVQDGRLVIPRLGEGDIERLSTSLDRFRDRFEFEINVGSASDERAERVRAALHELMVFFQERRLACKKEDVGKQILAAEQRLRSEFARLLKAFHRHKFELSMDAALSMPRINSWHPFAIIIGGAFKIALRRTNPHRRFGHSNDGPVARFVAAVIPNITGEHPTVQAVAKRLKDEARRQKRAG
jgi:hypothetical protein